MTVAECAAGVSLLTTSVQVVSTLIARYRCPARKVPLPPPADAPTVTLVRPVCGVDNYAEETLRSSFTLDYPNYDVIFCAARADDLAVALLRKIVVAYPHIPSKILIGNDEISANPKLNNCVKGWDAATSDWIILSDSNVLMPGDYIQRLLARYKADTGLVCSTPIGSEPDGFWAEVECGFLNSLQARWQYAAEAIGFGFAQGKSMLWRRSVLDEHGGVRALASELAEDAAATKLVRRAGLRVHLVDSPFQQPLGRRSLREVWARQVRWARLRRVTFLPFFLLEAFTGSMLPAVTGAYAAYAAGYDPLIAAALVLAIFMICEVQLALAAGWRCTLASIPAWLMRDMILPILFTSALLTDDFVWRGNEMTVREEEAKTG